MGHRLGDLAELAGAALHGDASKIVVAVRSLESAEGSDLAFATSKKYREAAKASKAGALLLPQELADAVDGDRLLAEDPPLALAKILAHMYPKAKAPAGAHPTAVIDEMAEVDPTASIGPYACIGASTHIGARVRVGSHVVIGRNCHLSEDVVLHPHVTLYDDTRIGARSEVHSGTVLGADGFGYASGVYGHVKLAQIGRAELGEDVEVGANSAIDRATLDVTRVGDGTKVDNLVQIGHNVVVGRSCLLCGHVGVAGSAKIGDGVVLAGQVGVSGHIEVGSGAQAAAKTLLAQSLEPGAVVGGIPAMPIQKWRRQVSSLRRLNEMRGRLRQTEKAIEQLQEAVDRVTAGPQGDGGE